MAAAYFARGRLINTANVEMVQRRPRSRAAVRSIPYLPGRE
jgi:hypothetical protein